ncbi:MAG: methylmalonyl Co-A mutase-associated GTPase MeaB [Rhodospirillales bacterium]|nr:methylmalonyl Co-A mutase-associated GTPase MeaB [Rhodospirillales bacterium]
MRHHPHSLAEAVLAGERRGLARAITLIESTRADHREAAEALLADLLPHTGRSIRIGISGVPGVGKSTFIEAFGLHVIGLGHRVAVLAVDPSSPRSGGSILGDKTRMEELSRRPEAFIRPSPAGGTLGGVARRTREAMLACEAAGFDVVIVETVGVGQSETAVADMVDLFLLLLVPGGGDELQGIKKGIVELADVIVVNKADGDLAAAAARAAAEYRNALRLLRPARSGWTPPVLRCSALSGAGIGEVWDTVTAFRERPGATAEIKGRRADQARSWMWNEVSETLLSTLREDDAVGRLLGELEAAVTSGKTTPTAAAQELLARFLAGKKS